MLYKAELDRELKSITLDLNDNSIIMDPEWREFLENKRKELWSLQRLEKIARNINAMDINFEYIDGDRNRYNFWRDLNTKLVEIIKQLSPQDRAALLPLCKPEKATYFGL